MRDHLPELTDAALLARADTDADAFAVLCARYAVRLDAWFRYRTTDPAVAAELTAETFAQAWRSRRRFRDEAGGSAAPWLYGIARNLLGRFHDRRRVETAARRRLGIPQRDYGADPELDAVDERLAAETCAPFLRDALATLTPAQRSALELRVVQDVDYADVAARLGCSPAAARLHVSRALRSLRTRLQGVKP
jgi:RNA polymerase sigma-70 factor (ECF subfamily)